MRKAISLLLAFCMLLTLLPMPAIAANTLPFSDVKESDWFYDGIAYSYENGLMIGTSDTTFSPKQSLSRGMLVTVLWRMNGCPEASGATFADVHSGRYYSTAVAWAEQNDLVKGYEDESFRPDNSITREQIVTVLFRYANFAGYDTSVSTDLTGFIDAGRISSWANEAMKWAVAANLMKGRGKGILDPNSTAVRAEAAAILKRFSQNVHVIPSEDKYQVTFVLNDGSEGSYAMQVVTKNGTASKPEDPVRELYRFTGWYTDSEASTPYDFSTPVTNDITLYAGWSILEEDLGECRVTFVLNDGSEGAYAMQVIAKNQHVARPDDPARDLYSFTGWYTNSAATNLYDFSTPVSADLILYAGWGATEENEGLYAAETGGGTVYSITGIEMNENTVNVTINVNSTCVLAVQFMDENTKDILATASTQTPNYCELTPISMTVANDLPEHFLVMAMLLDGNGDPLCEPFTCIKYTSAYERFDAQTIDDFPGRTVLNFDNDRTTNFGVLNDKVLQIECTGITNILSATAEVINPNTESDLQTLTFVYRYTLKNPDDQVRSLQAGQNVLLVGNNERYLAKIGIIETTADGSVVITASDETEMTDFYDVLKVDMVISTGNNSSNSNPQKNYIQRTQERQIATQGIEIIDVDGEWSASLGTGLDWEPTDKIKVSGEFKGTGTVELEMVYDLHIFGEDFFSCSIISALELNIGIEVKASIDNSEAVKNDFKLAKVLIPTPVTGLNLYFAPTLPTEWKISGGGKFNYTTKTKSGFTFDTNSGYQPIDKKERTVTLAFEGEVAFKIGPKVTLGAEFLKIVKAEVGAQAGIDITVSTQLGYEDTTAESQHACTLCLDGKAKWFVAVTAKLSLEINKKLTYTPLDADLVKLEGWINFLKLQPGQFYFSIINSADSIFGGSAHFGGGSCPNKFWRIGISVEDSDGNEINSNVVIKKADGTLLDSRSAPHTFYLYDGIYNVSTTIGNISVSKSFVVNSSKQDITLTSNSQDGKLSGRVCDSETKAPVPGAVILIKQGDMIITSLTTGANGSYEIVLPCGTYRVEITKPNYITFVDYETVEDGRTTYLETALLISGNWQLMGGFSGRITDAVTGDPVVGVTLSIRSGWNNPGDGDVIERIITDDGGNFIYATKTIVGVVFGLQSGNYTVSASKAGYTTTSFNVIVLPGTVTPGQDATISPTMEEGEYRIVLRWGASPSDLDSHYNAITAGGFRDHVYYYNRFGATATLDQDVTTSYGPETVTITSFEELPEGFTYSVHDFTNLNSTYSTAMSESGAWVSLYNGNSLLRVYHIPVNCEGTVWNVFSIDASGSITDLNTFEYCDSPGDVGASFVVGSVDMQNAFTPSAYKKSN